MTAFEAICVGEVTVAVLRQQRGRPLDFGDLRVTVLGEDGTLLMTNVTVAEMRGSRGGHRGLICARCGHPKKVLVISDTKLTCRSCAKQRTPHQRFKRTRAWRRHQERLVDELERLARRGLTTHVAGERGEALARRIIAGHLADFEKMTTSLFEVLNQ